MANQETEKATNRAPTSGGALILHGSVSDLAAERGPNTGRGPRFSPAESPPEYEGLTHINWGWKSQTAEWYRDRASEIRDLHARMREIPAMHRADFTAGHWVSGVVSALTQAFELSPRRLESLEDLLSLDALQSTHTRPREMASAGLFGTIPLSKNHPSDPITDFEQLCNMRLEEINFDALRYGNDTVWPLSNKDILGRDRNYILLMRTGAIEGEFGSGQRLVVKLMPLTQDALLDPGFVRFYALLCDYGIPGAMDVQGQYSLRDAFLGRYDADAVGNSDIPLFPQYCRPSLLLAGPTITDKSGPFTRPDSRGPFEDLRVLQEQEDVRDPDTGEVDPVATKLYREICKRFDYGGPKLDRIADELRAIEDGTLGKGRLNDAQVDFLCTAIVTNFSEVLCLGTIKQLEGLDLVIGAFRGRRFNVPQEVADKLRMYYEMLPAEVITNVLMSINSAGNVTPDVYKLPRQSKKDAEDPTLAAIATALGAEKYERASLVSAFDINGLPTDLSRYQHKLVPILLAYVAEHARGITVTPEMLYEIKLFGEILQIMRGGRSDLEKLEFGVAQVMVPLLEHTVGLPLPELRGRLSHEVREQLALLPNPFSAAEESLTFVNQPSAAAGTKAGVEAAPVNFSGDPFASSFAGNSGPLDWISDADLLADRRSPSSFFHDAKEAEEEGDLQAFFKLAGQSRRKAFLQGKEYPPALDLATIKIEVRQNTRTGENLEGQTGLSTETILEIASAIGAARLDGSSQGWDLNYRLMEIHGLAGYFVGALAILDKLPEPYRRTSEQAREA